jgi:hypothetical protein
MKLYRQHRKNLNDHLGITIALAASGAAIWSGYEVAERSLQVQQDSVKAQDINYAAR